MKNATFLIVLILFSFDTWAKFDSKGFVGFESRFFHDDKDRNTQDFGFGLVSRVEVDHSTDQFSNRVQVFSRSDGKDRSRDHIYIEELYSKFSKGSFSALLGYQVLNWSTAEAFAPSDIVNSRNYDTNFENAEKLGEPMLELSYLGDNFEARVYYFPLAVKPRFPEPGNRLNPIPSILTVNNFEFLDDDGEFIDTSKLVNQYGLQFKGVFGDFEFDVFYVHHFDRTDLKFLQSGPVQLTPYTTLVDHSGFSTNYVLNEFIFKSEFVFRDFKDQIVSKTPVTPIPLDQEDYGILSLGIEYLMEHVSGAETNFIFEGQSLLFTGNDIREEVIPFQRDLLFGIRHSLNDVAGREFFFSIIADVEIQKEILASVKYSQRFGENWKGQLGLRYIDAPPSTPFDINGLRSLHKDHQLDMSLTRYF